jgi:hypothetical protein
MTRLTLAGLQAEIDELRGHTMEPADTIAAPGAPLRGLAPDELAARRAEDAEVPHFLRVRGPSALAPAVDDIDPDTGKRVQPAQEPMWEMRNGRTYQSGAQPPQLPQGWGGIKP